MSFENEVKYVLKSEFDANVLKGWKQKPILQGYLGNSALLINEDGHKILVYRDWAGTDRHAMEIRIQVDPKDFDALWPTCMDIKERDLYFGSNKSSVQVGRLPKTPRIRQYGGEYLFTYKDWVPGLSERPEIEDKICASAFQDLWPNCKDTMFKDRYVQQKDDGIEWAVDFMRENNDPQGDIYFVLAEAEMPAGMDRPSKIIKPVRGEVIFEVPKTNNEYTSRKLCDEDYARQKLKEIGYTP